jgi:hypothetical protein
MLLPRDLLSLRRAPRPSTRRRAYVRLIWADHSAQSLGRAGVYPREKYILRVIGDRLGHCTGWEAHTSAYRVAAACIRTAGRRHLPTGADRTAGCSAASEAFWRGYQLSITVNMLSISD